MAAVVVAITFVTEARSKILDSVTAGAPVSEVKVPKAFRATSASRWSTAMEAPGKEPWAIASRKISNARANFASCGAKDRVGK
jgi:hypothetical protein